MLTGAKRPQELRLALGRTEQASGALDVAMCSAPPGGSKGEWASRARKGSNRKVRTPAIDEPFVADALGLEERNSSRCASRACPSTSALSNVPSTSPCSAPRLVAKVAPVGREVWSRLSVATPSMLTLPGSACAGPGGCAATQRCQYVLMRSKSAATSGSSVPLTANGFNGAAPVAKALASAKHTNAPLMHAQDLGAKSDLVLVDEPFGAGEPQHHPS